VTEQPQPQSLPSGMGKRAIAAISNNIVVILGLSVLMVILGAVVLAFFDKVMPEAVLVMGGVALGYLGNAIQNDKGAT
jgi:cytochrome c biogenesis protein CcdA